MDVENLPVLLQDDAKAAWARIAAAAGEDMAGELVAAEAASLPRVVACSRFAAATLEKAPQEAISLVRDGRLDRPLAPGELDRLIEAQITGEGAEAAVMTAFRRFRCREMLRIAWRDLAGRAALDETLGELSALADSCLRHATAIATRDLAERHGVPRNRNGEPVQPVFLAMGKLGGNELNFSSDIDLVLLFADPGDSDGPRPLANERYFSRLGQRVIRLLDEVTGDGFVFRVDMRLRPFGATGALALSFDAFEAYLVQHGREWERYAYLKARPVTGSEADAHAVTALIRPFVYRRYLDFGVFESLRDMKAMIRSEVARRDMDQNIKLGPGGIREIEFIGQAYQLIRGGSEPALQTRGIVTVLTRLADRRHLPDAAVAELLAAYDFLRRLENRIQALDDRQTHQVPDDKPDRARLALAMNQPDWPALEILLAGHRDAVERHFESVMFGTNELQGDERASDPLAAVWDGTAPDPDAALSAAGFADPDRVIAALARLRSSVRFRRLDERGLARVDRLMPAMLTAAGVAVQSEDAVDRLVDIVAAVGLRSAYFALLTENPVALNRLVDLCARSSLVARQVAADPLLLDTLIDPALYTEAPSREQFALDLAQRFEGLGPGGDEPQQDALSRFQRSAVFQVVVADLSGILPLMKVSDRLTDIAELVLEQSLRLARETLAQRHGLPWCTADGQRRPAGFGIVAYGKLGGLELGYGSDLDIVFLHDSEGEDQHTDGARELDNGRFVARMAQRIVTMLTTQTGAGAMYDVDTRLRPSGRAGLLVSSLIGFEDYQTDQAWTWEHQALLRARGVAGDAAVLEGFEAIRRRILTSPRDPAGLREQVVTMRRRMRRELAGPDPDRFYIKGDAGGITDIEFLVQYWVLRWASEHPVLVRWSDNIRQLDDLASAGLIPLETATLLQDAYRGYRRRLHRLSLMGAEEAVARDEFDSERAAVTELWRKVFGGDGE